MSKLRMPTIEAYTSSVPLEKLHSDVRAILRLLRKMLRKQDKHRVHKSSARDGTGRDDWQTPDWIFQRLGEIGLDPCAAPGSTRAMHSLSGGAGNGADGLAANWCELIDDAQKCDCGDLIYVNYPYSQARLWVRKIVEEAARLPACAEIIVLCPDRNSKAQRAMFAVANAVAHLNDRVKFVGATSGAPFDSMLVYFGSNKAKFAETWKDVARIEVLR